MDDIDAICDIQRLVNETNFSNSVTNVYTFDNNANKMGVHARKSILFTAEIEDLPIYLESQLTEFFTNAQHFKYALMQKKADAGNGQQG